MNNTSKCLNAKSIKKNDDFKKMYRKGKSVVGAYIVMYSVKKSFEENKKELNFGITVSKKIGKAVKRNRARRLIKEAIRLNQKLFDKDYKYVFVARIRINGIAYREVEKNLRYLLAIHKKQIKEKKTR